MVETIWRGQSALSSECDLAELCLVRWEAGIQWSPWNTILLTGEEAQAHIRIERVTEVCVFHYLTCLDMLTPPSLPPSLSLFL